LNKQKFGDFDNINFIIVNKFMLITGNRMPVKNGS